MLSIDRICIAQFDPQPGDVAGNARRMVESIGQARDKGAALVVFPEEVISGYCIGDHNRSSLLVEGSLAALLEQIVPATAGIAVVLGLVAPDLSCCLGDGALGARNRYAVVQDRKLLRLGAKTLLADDGVLNDTRYFLPQSPSEEGPVTLSDGTRLGVLICQDIWDDFAATKPALNQAEKGAELLLVLNASPYYVGRRKDRIEIARRRVLETSLPMVYVNTVGAQDNGKNVILFDGGSFVLDRKGDLVAEAPQFQEGTWLVGELAESWKRGGKEGDWNRVDELLLALRFGLEQFFRRLGTQGAVIGLSGGIDSALNAVLVSQVLGAERLLALNMPSRFSSQLTRSAASKLALNLGIEYRVHPIEQVVATKRQEYERISGRTMKTLTFENIQARERGNLLMTWAQELGRVVVGNGNKTEFQRGYATLYGDIVGAIMPLGDVAKTDVYRLARRLNEENGGVIPQAILDVAPSAELSEAQDVNLGLGDPFDYDVEAPLGVELIEYGLTPADLRRLFEARRLDAELWEPVRGTVSVYDKMDGEHFEALAWEVFRAIESSVFKRIQSPPVLKVSRKAFGFDLRESMFVRMRL